jgi:mannose-6-phosphate isomerase-like protein (cupin superfamily)
LNRLCKLFQRIHIFIISNETTKAARAIDEKHFHRQLFEIYLIANGTSTVIVDDREVKVKAGDTLVIEPNEVHSFSEFS